MWVAIGLALLGVVTPILRTDPVVIKLCYALGLSSAVRSYLLTARGLLQGLERFDLEAIVVVSDRVLLLVAGSAALWAGYGLFGLAAAFVGSRLLMLCAVQILLRRVVPTVRPAFDRAIWRDVQSAALPLGFFMIALNTYTYIDTVILGLMRTDAEVGWYAASYRVYEGLTYAPSILAAVLTPRLSYLFSLDRTAHRALLWAWCSAAAPCSPPGRSSRCCSARPMLPRRSLSRFWPAARCLCLPPGSCTRGRSRRTSIGGCC
jgi:O-antigen/teichoic acid export membrane protein